jgi:hypothetical protein
MMNEVCINQGIHQQQQSLQQQLAGTTTSRISTNALQNQGSLGVVTESTSLLQPQSFQGGQALNTVQAVSQSSNNGVSTSSSSGSSMATFEVNNTGVMYLLQLFGLVGNIPNNCASFTPEFKCLRCGTGFLLNTAGACVTQTTTTSPSSNIGNVGIFGSTSSTSQPASTNSGSAFNSGSSFSSFGSQSSSVVNTDPNCQTPNSDGSCSQCYFRYFYSPNTRQCTVVNPLCATWDRFGSCLSCYPGYRLTGTSCLIDIQTSTNAQPTSQSTSQSAS